MSAGLELRGVSMRFGDVLAVDALSHVFEAGSITAIVGPSGSGKSTTLALIAGLLRPSAGSILLDGEDIGHLPAEQRGFGVVFQSYALFPHMTVRENAEFGLRVRAVPAEDRVERAHEVLALLRIEHLAERPVTALSGGEQQRVAIARALAFRPRLLMLDEPLAALDAALRERLRGELGQLLRELDVTVLYVTHDQIEAMSLADQLVVMDRGRVEQAGSPQRLYFEPESLFVARFLGVPNLVEADVLAGAERGACVRLRLPCATVHIARKIAVGPCWAVLRPEDVHVTAAGAGDCVARVLGRSFLGDRMRLRVDSTGCRLLVDAPARSRWETGMEVGLRFDPARVWTLSRGLPAG